MTETLAIFSVVKRVATYFFPESYNLQVFGCNLDTNKAFWQRHKWHLVSEYQENTVRSQQGEMSQKLLLLERAEQLCSLVLN